MKKKATEAGNRGTATERERAATNDCKTMQPTHDTSTKIAVSWKSAISKKKNASKIWQSSTVEIGPHCTWAVDDFEFHHATRPPARKSSIRTANFFGVATETRFQKNNQKNKQTRYPR